MQMKPTVKEVVSGCAFLFGLGATWATLSARVSAQEKAVEPVPGLVIKQVVIETKLDYLIGLIEYKYGIRAEKPARIGHRGQRNESLHLP